MPKLAGKPRPATTRKLSHHMPRSYIPFMSPARRICFLAFTLNLVWCLGCESYEGVAAAIFDGNPSQMTILPSTDLGVDAQGADATPEADDCDVCLSGHSVTPSVAALPPGRHTPTIEFPDVQPAHAWIDFAPDTRPPAAIA